MKPMTDPARGEVERGAKLYDKTGREIMIGDVVKVDHFIHYLRRRRCYMHKQVVGERVWSDGSTALRLGHLDMTDKDYYEAKDGRRLLHYEIVQGAHDDFYDRPRQHLGTGEGGDGR